MRGIIYQIILGLIFYFILKFANVSHELAIIASVTWCFMIELIAKK